MAPNAKRRKVDNAIEEINFDNAARHEYLTGFHKRKVQRIKLAQEHAEKRAREEKREERRKIREQRAAEIEQAVQESKRMLKEANAGSLSGESDSDDDEEWEGFEEPAPVDYEEEYIDEDKYTTVTVEEMGLSKDALHNADNAASSSNDADDGADQKVKEVAKSKPEKKFGSKSGIQKKKKKKQFRYESKEDRKITRRKERTGSRKKASDRRDR